MIQYFPGGSKIDGIIGTLNDLGFQWAPKSIVEAIAELKKWIADTGTNIRQPPYNAYGDGQSHPLSTRFSTLDDAKKTFPFLAQYLTDNPDVDWKTLEIDFCAIKQSLDDINCTVLPKGTFLINRPIEREHIRLIGVGRTRSKIVSTDSSQPVIITGGVPFIADLYIGHQSIPSTSEVVPNGAGIYLKTGLDDGAIIKRLYIENVTSGIILNDGSGAHCYSSTFSDMRITRFRHSAIYIGGSGHTGNVFYNIYAVNWNDFNAGTKLSSPYGYVFKGMDDGIFSQLNLEHGYYGKGIVISGSKIEINSIHFEGYVANENYGGLFYVDGTASRVTLRNVSLVYSFFDKANISDYSFLVLGDNGTVEIDGFTERDNTVTNAPILHKFYGTSTIVSGAAIYAKKFRMLNNLFNSNDYFPNTPVVPYLRQFNDDLYYWTNGGKRRFVGTAMPTSGTYNKQDEVYNINKVEQGTAGNKYVVDRWLRLTDGSNHVLGTDWLEIRLYTGN